ILSIDVLEHVPDEVKALANLAGRLRPGGRFYMHVPTVREKPVLFNRYLNRFKEGASEEHHHDDKQAEQWGREVQASGITPDAVRRTFGRYTGEMATSLFMVPYDSPKLPALVSVPCLALAFADFLGVERTRYAVAITGRKS